MIASAVSKILAIIIFYIRITFILVSLFIYELFIEIPYDFVIILIYYGLVL